MNLSQTLIVKKLTQQISHINNSQAASAWYKNKGSNVQISRLLFRVFFTVLVGAYALVMFEFIDLSYIEIEFNISPEVLIMSILASLFVYLYVRKSKL